VGDGSQNGTQSLRHSAARVGVYLERSVIEELVHNLSNISNGYKAQCPRGVSREISQV